jgi:hypothetical protein
MRVLTAIAMVACLTAPAWAQMDAPPSPAELDAVKKKQEAETADKAYQEMMKRAGNRPNNQPAPKKDPWGAMR